MSQLKTEPCDRQHFDCPWYHQWDTDKTAGVAFGTLGFIVVVFLAVWLGTLLWSHTVAAKPPTAEQVTLIRDKAKADQDREQMHINECLKIGAYWNSTGDNCQKP